MRYEIRDMKCEMWCVEMWNTKSAWCTICDFVSSYKSSLKQHIKSVHEEEKPYQCIVCAYSCSAKQRLKRHIDSMHGETPLKNQKTKKFECPLCSTIFKSNQERVNHKKLIHWECDMYNYSVF